MIDDSSKDYIDLKFNNVDGQFKNVIDKIDDVKKTTDGLKDSINTLYDRSLDHEKRITAIETIVENGKVSDAKVRDAIDTIVPSIRDISTWIKEHEKKHEKKEGNSKFRWELVVSLGAVLVAILSIIFSFLGG